MHPLFFSSVELCHVVWHFQSARSFVTHSRRVGRNYCYHIVIYAYLLFLVSLVKSDLSTRLLKRMSPQWCYQKGHGGWQIMVWMKINCTTDPHSEFKAVLILIKFGGTFLKPPLPHHINRAIYTREIKPRITQSEAYVSRELSHLYDHGLHKKLARGLRKPRTSFSCRLYEQFAACISRGFCNPRLIFRRINGPNVGFLGSLPLVVRFTQEPRWTARKGERPGKRTSNT